MINIKKIICIIMAAMLLAASGCTESGSNTTVTASTSPASTTFYKLGDKMDDFTVKTADGIEMSLYAILEEKEMVLLNFWASWCGPCESEFPFIQQAYEQYSSKVEVLALDVESADSDATIIAYGKKHGLTFPLASETAGLHKKFGIPGFPYSVAVDRFGVICMISAGKKISASPFIAIFDALTGEDYTESVLFEELPERMPNIEPITSEELGKALNTESGTLVFENDSNKLSWPMLSAEADGRHVLYSSNASVESSSAVVKTRVNISAGDALAVTFKISSERSYDTFEISVNGDPVKHFGGETDWTRYAISFPSAGEYEVSFTYKKDKVNNIGADTLWIDSIEHLTGIDANTAKMENPKYPLGYKSAITVLNESAKKIVITDPQNTFVSPDMNFCIMGDKTVNITATLASDKDPETVVIIYNNNETVSCIADGMTDKGYSFSFPMNDPDTAYTPYTTIIMADNLESEKSIDNIHIFPDEETLNELIDAYNKIRTEENKVTWKYVEEEAFIDTTPMISFNIRYVDQYGDPVEGVKCQACNSTTCNIFMSDKDGYCRIYLPVDTYRISSLRLPDGYSGKHTSYQYIPVEGETFTIHLTKD